MAKFEESSLFQALTAEDKTKESILSALGSAAVDLSLRSSNGQTYIHLAATHLSSLDVPEAWEILLSKCSMFVRDSSGVSGLSAMIDGLQYAMFTKYVKSYLIAVGSDDDRKKNFMQQAVLSGKTLHLKQLARVAKADKSLIEMLQDMVALEEDLMEAHKIGRTALHYAVCMKGEVAEAIVKILTDAKADEQIKDINGLDVTAMKADPLDMEAFVASYESNLLKQSSSEMIYKVHDSVLSGDLRTVKMSLNRRELAVMPDASKLTPLHKAVILKHTAIALWIAEQFKTTMDIREGVSMTSSLLYRLSVIIV
ncbi:hypothetical protein EB796_002669 [Bugula neritina]|uniref:Uncharacterized protein n=1 Tax=Bugula neritina TaxID=10212 RepID=A0A7J7KLJ4_BUGNE|nr:hypothetical protein EB796_002669 [Bugula neritina]